MPGRGDDLNADRQRAARDRHGYDRQADEAQRLGEQADIRPRRHLFPVHRDRRLAEQRSEEHTSELQSLMRISYAVFCLKKKKIHDKKTASHHVTKDLTRVSSNTVHTYTT